MAIYSHRPAALREEALVMFADMAKKFFDEHAPEATIAQWMEDGVIPRSLSEKAREAGLLGISIGVAYGGPGADFRHGRRRSRRCTAAAWTAFGAHLHNVIVAPYYRGLWQRGTEAALASEDGHWRADRGRCGDLDSATASMAEYWMAATTRSWRC